MYAKKEIVKNIPSLHFAMWMEVEIKNKNQKSNNKLIKHTVGSQGTISFELELEYSKHSTHNFMVQMVCVIMKPLTTDLIKRENFLFGLILY